MKIKIVLADDHQIFRDGLVSLLESDESLEVVGVAKTGDEAIAKASELQPDILMMDITMPKMDGIEATSQIKREMPGMKVIALSMHSDKQYVLGMLKAGIDAYLIKSCTGKKLIEVIHSVHENKKYLSNEITELVINDYLSTQPKY